MNWKFISYTDVHFTVKTDYYWTNYTVTLAISLNGGKIILLQEKETGPRTEDLRPILPVWQCLFCLPKYSFNVRFYIWVIERETAVCSNHETVLLSFLHLSDDWFWKFFIWRDPKCPSVLILLNCLTFRSIPQRYPCTRNNSSIPIKSRRSESKIDSQRLGLVRWKKRSGPPTWCTRTKK